MLKCPICARPLSKETHHYYCPQKHSFDVSKTGVVHLLRSQSSKDRGDNKDLILARHRFLSSDAYQPLRNALIETLKTVPFESLVDLGCGEGYYTKAVMNVFPTTQIIGVDLSKEGLKLASKQNTAQWVCASIADLPILDHQIDVALSLFVPVYPKEIQRILKDQGYLITLTPNPRHLYELKAALYPKVILNEAQTIPHPAYTLLHSEDICFTINLNSIQQKNDLLMMTPYAYTSKKEAIEAYLALKTFDITCDVSLKIYKVSSKET